MWLERFLQAVSFWSDTRIAARRMTSVFPMLALLGLQALLIYLNPGLDILGELSGAI